MNNQSYYQILSIIEEIELTDKLLIKLNKVDEPLNETLFGEIRRKKRNLIKEMLKEMIDAGLSFIEFESLYTKLFSYLKKDDKKANFPIEFQKNVKRAEQFLAI